jgi:hypothetical protein
MAIERGVACTIILGEKKTHGPLSLLGDRRISINIQWCGCVEWR